MGKRDSMTQVIEAHCATLTNGDKEGWLKLWAEDATIEDPVGTPAYRGKPALAGEFWALIEEISPMALSQEREPIVCGNEAIAILHARVTRAGARLDVGPIIDHYVFNEAGEIVSMRAFWNQTEDGATPK